MCLRMLLLILDACGTRRNGVAETYRKSRQIDSRFTTSLKLEWTELVVKDWSWQKVSNATCEIECACWWLSSLMLTQQWFRRRRCRGCKRTPKCFDLLKIRAKSLKTWAKPLKIWAKRRPRFAVKQLKTIFWGHPTKTVSNCCNDSFLGKCGQKSFAPPKFPCCYTYVMQSDCGE